eukprot:4953380-Alexandrium_andersonii.AAC.1
MVLRDGHYRSVLLSAKQISSLYKGRGKSVGASAMRDFQRAAGGEGGSGSAPECADAVSESSAERDRLLNGPCTPSRRSD